MNTPNVEFLLTVPSVLRYNELVVVGTKDSYKIYIGNSKNRPVILVPEIPEAVSLIESVTYSKLNQAILNAELITKPNQTYYVNTLFIGDGGANILNIGADAGDFNLAVGFGAGKDTTIAKKNTLIGANAGNKITSGWANTFVGYNAGSSGVGTGDLTISGTGVEFYANVGIGESVLSLCTTGSYNTAIGSSAMLNNTTGSFNTAIGVHALNDNISGTYNVAVAHSALRNNTTGNRNIAIGYGALINVLAIDDLIAIGCNAQAANVTGQNNIAIGTNSLVTNTNGAAHVAIGYQSLFNSNYDSGCTAIGYQAGYGNAVNSNYNTYIGFVSGKSITTGAINNTFIGAEAGNNASQLATAGNTTCIGYGTYSTVSNTVVIGNASVTDVYFGSVSGAAKIISSKARFTAIPTSASGLSAGDVWSNGGVLTIV